MARIVKVSDSKSPDACAYNIARRDDIAAEYEAFLNRFPESPYSPAIKQLLGRFVVYTVPAGHLISEEQLKSEFGWNGSRGVACGAFSKSTTITEHGDVEIRWRPTRHAFCMGNLQIAGTVELANSGFRFEEPAEIARLRESSTLAWIPEWVGLVDDREAVYRTSKPSIVAWQVSIQERRGPWSYVGFSGEDPVVEQLICQGFDVTHRWWTWHGSKQVMDELLASEFLSGRAVVIHDSRAKPRAQALKQVLRERLDGYDITVLSKSDRPGMLRTNYPNADLVVAYRLKGDELRK